MGVNWVLTDEHLDVETELALGFLNYLMLGTNAAPLTKVRFGDVFFHVDVFYAPSYEEVSPSVT